MCLIGPSRWVRHAYQALLMEELPEGLARKGLRLFVADVVERSPEVAAVGRLVYLSKMWALMVDSFGYDVKNWFWARRTRYALPAQSEGVLAKRQRARRRGAEQGRTVSGQQWGIQGRLHWSGEKPSSRGVSS